MKGSAFFEGMSWHFQLFEPCIRAGIIKASEKASVEEEIDDFEGFVLSLIQAPR